MNDQTKKSEEKSLLCGRSPYWCLGSHKTWKSSQFQVEWDWWNFLEFLYSVESDVMGELNVEQASLGTGSAWRVLLGPRVVCTRRAACDKCQMIRRSPCGWWERANVEDGCTPDLSPIGSNLKPVRKVGAKPMTRSGSRRIGRSK